MHKYDEEKPVKHKKILVDNDQSSSDDDDIDDSYDISSDDDFDSDFYDSSFTENIDCDERFSKNKDDRIMFSESTESNQTVSDVILMMLAMIVKFNYTREHQTALINFVKELAGPRFNTWNCSPYLLSKAV